MGKSNLEKVNEELDKIIFDDEPLFLDDFSFERFLCEIVLKNGKKFNLDNDEMYLNTYKTKSKLAISNSLEIAHDFFCLINEKYGEEFNKSIANGLFIFEKRVDDSEKSCYDFDLDHEFIRIKYYNSIEDVYEIVHEFMHYLNNGANKATNVSGYYTEAFSSFIEIVLTDFLVSSYPMYSKDALKMNRACFMSLYETCIKNKILYEMIESKLDGKEINAYELTEIVKKVNTFCDSEEIIEAALDEVVDEVIIDSESSFNNAIRYSIAFPLATRMYKLYNEKDGKKYITELNDYLFKLDFISFLNCLDLDSDEEKFNISSESLKELEKDYQKVLKKIW